MFASFDRDGSGAISSSELGDALTAAGKRPTQRELVELVKEADKNNDGKIDFNEFLVMMVSLTSDLDPITSIASPRSLRCSFDMRTRTVADTSTRHPDRIPLHVVLLIIKRALVSASPWGPYHTITRPRSCSGARTTQSHALDHALVPLPHNHTPSIMLTTSTTRILVARLQEKTKGDLQTRVKSILLEHLGGEEDC